MPFSGFPSICWDERKQKYKHASTSLKMNGQQFAKHIQDLFPRLEGVYPKFYKLDNNRRIQKDKPEAIESAECIKNLNYLLLQVSSVELIIQLSQCMNETVDLYLTRKIFIRKTLKL